MQINVMRHLGIRMILQMKFHRVALTNTDETTRHRATESPEGVFHAFGNFHLDFPDFQLDDHLGWCCAACGRWHVRWAGQNGFYRLALRRTKIASGRAAGIGAACSKRLAKEGIAVGVLDLDEERCAETVQAIKDSTTSLKTLEAAKGVLFTLGQLILSETAAVRAASVLL